MTNTSIERCHQEYERKAVLYHCSDNGKIKCTKRTNLSDRIPGGGIQSTVTDMLKFGDAILDETFITAATLDLMRTDSDLKNPMGMEHDGYRVTDKSGMEVALCGLNMTLRDYAKMGSLYLNHGKWNDQQIVPMEWVKASLTPDAPHLQPTEYSLGYGY
ncbi:MAG: CubicO group peptidase (beta-lactamase class C family) [Paraglaciecola sp.]|jgi:CubicO group peptidase (beta-lactamase class C family)